MLFVVIVWCSIQCLWAQTIHADAPFPMSPIELYRFPDRDFPITRYGAREGDKGSVTHAIAVAMEKAHRAGGGRIVIPAGEWLTGAIHFRSNVNLYLSEGATLVFSDDPNDYLPAVQSSWEGLECMNYSPLIYAFDCQNIAITGSGKLRSLMDTWTVWSERPQAHLEASTQLYAMAATDVPVEKRIMTDGEAHMRPQLIQFNRCTNVRLEQFQIENSPFWTIHMLLCRDGYVNGVKVYAHGHNNDGIDIEMSRHFIIENCEFDQGDDAVVIKSGRNRDAWRLNTPTEDIVVRNCTIVNGHALLGIGSELSGGVRNVFMSHCHSQGAVKQVLQIKTNHRRGGFVEGIYVDDIQTHNTLRVLAVYTDVMYQWRALVPTYEERITRIGDIHVSNVTCDNTQVIYEILGDAREPVRGVEFRNVTVKTVTDFLSAANNVIDLVTDGLHYQHYTPAVHPKLYSDRSTVKVEK